MTTSIYDTTSSAAWQLLVATPLGPQAMRIVISEEAGVRALHVLTSEGWRREDVDVVGDEVRFLSDGAIFPYRFTLDLNAQTGKAVGSGALDTVGLAMSPTTVEMTPVDLPDVRLLGAVTPTTGSFGRYLPVLREEAELAGYTLYRPVGKGPFPAIVWGNGGARPSNEEFITFLMQVAAHGFMIIAAGAPGARFTPPIGNMSTETLERALDWLITIPASLPELDASRIAVMGQSAGASQAWMAAAHPAVRSLVALNGGSKAVRSDPSIVRRVAVPSLLVTGGHTDAATEALRTDWSALNNTLPALLADHADAGHIGLLHGTNDPFAAALGARPLGQEVEVQLCNLTVAWLDWTLHDDERGLRYVGGADSPLAALDGWTIEARNLPSS